jgi:FAD/FMN-containing dehydrogenase
MTLRWEPWTPTIGAGHPDPLVDRLTALVGIGRVAVLARAEGSPAPRALVWPESSESVQRVLRVVREAELPWTVVGTPPPFDPPDVAAGVVYVCLERMAGLLAVDETSLVAQFQTGIRWERAEDLLSRRGLTLGPLPGPVRSRTIAESIAENDRLRPSAAYGQLIEAIQGVTAVLPDGERARTVVAPRRATGPELTAAVFGTRHRGALVTEVSLQVWRRTGEATRRACAAADWASAAAFVRSCLCAGIRPAFVLASGRGPVELGFEVTSAAAAEALHRQIQAGGVTPRSRHDVLDALLSADPTEPAWRVIAVVPAARLSEAAVLVPEAICPDLGGPDATLWARRSPEPLVARHLVALGARVPGIPTGFEDLEATFLGHLARRA